MGLLITDTLREFAPLKLSTPVIYISPGENDRELDQVVLFSSIVVLRKPLTVGALASAVRQLAANRNLNADSGTGPSTGETPFVPDME